MFFVAVGIGVKLRPYVQSLKLLEFTSRYYPKNSNC